LRRHTSEERRPLLQLDEFAALIVLCPPVAHMHEQIYNRHTFMSYSRTRRAASTRRVDTWHNIFMQRKVKESADIIELPEHIDQIDGTLMTMVMEMNGCFHYRPPTDW
jgi:hypothetical protein